jgi:L-threonylcarbamoyladenylate synthase
VNPARPPLDTAAAASRLAAGGVLILPTDTICGLHARIDCPAALARLATLKGRAPERPLLVLASSLEQARALCLPLSPEQSAWCAAAWPGPFTFILPAGDGLPAAVRDVQRGTVAVRVPGRPDLHRLIEQAGGALASTSANVTGDRPLTDLSAAVEAFGDRIDGWWAGEDPQPTGCLASALVDLTTSPPTILRPGPLPLPAPKPHDS